MEQMKMQVSVKNVYGRDLVYPVDETAMRFSKLLGVKTFNDHHLRVIQEIGFKVEVVNLNEDYLRR